MQNIFTIAKVFSRVFFYHLIANAKRTVLEKLLIRNRILEKKVRIYFMWAKNDKKRQVGDI